MDIHDDIKKALPLSQAILITLTKTPDVSVSMTALALIMNSLDQAMPDFEEKFIALRKRVYTHLPLDEIAAEIKDQS